MSDKNPTLAPRERCGVCKGVKDLADVAWRLYDAELNPLPIAPAREYLRSIGIAGTRSQLDGMLKSHRKHIDRWLAAEAVVTPLHIEEGVQRLPQPAGRVGWLDVNEAAMEVGSSALALIAAQLGGLDPKDQIQVAKLGLGAAHTRASLEMKGAIKRAQAIGAVASGFRKPTT